MLSVVIPTYQRSDSLQLALDALATQTLPADQYEVIVSIDGSTDATEPMLAALQMPYRLRWISGPNRGAGIARNRGAAAAKGALLLFLDDDIIAESGLLAAHLSLHQSAENLVGLGQVRLWPRCRLTGWEQYLNQWFDTHYDKMGEANYRPNFWDCLSGNFSLSRTLFETVGGFSSTLSTSKHEDIDLGFALAQQQATFSYQPAALGYHRFVKGVDGGLRDATATGYSLVRFLHGQANLGSDPLAAQWQQYRWREQQLFGWAIKSPKRMAWLVWLAWLLLTIAERLPKGWWNRPIYQLAYHTHFWHGVARESVAIDCNLQAKTSEIANLQFDNTSEV